jgi:hypothetical protein
MANAPRRELSSAFDDMLSKSKKSLDDLYRGAPGGNSTKPVFLRSQAPGGVSAASGTSSGTVLGDDSIAVRTLNERLGRDWRYEVAEQKRDGDEAIVLCKLTFGKDRVSRAQFGRAKMSSESVAGASGGVAFKLGAGSASAESEAFRRATEAALMNCAALI